MVIKALDPDWIRIRIGLQPQPLDPDPEKMNTDPEEYGGHLMMRAMAMESDDEDDEARLSQTLLERPQRSHEESTNKYKYGK